MINYTAVLVASVVIFLLGWLWYSPVLFGNVWMKLKGMTKAQINAGKKKGMKGMLVPMIFSVISTFVMLFVLNLMIEYTGALTIMDTVSVAFLVWIGFIAAPNINMVIWEKKPFALYLITTVHHLVAFILAGIILVMW